MTLCPTGECVNSLSLCPSGGVEPGEDNNTGDNNTGGNNTGNITDGTTTPIPSIGMVGTVVAISAGFFIAIRREDEE